MRAIVSASKGINAIKSSKFFVAVGDYYFKVFVISLTGKTVKNKWIIFDECEKILIMKKKKEKSKIRKNPKNTYSKLEMKKKTLAAWTKLLLNSGEIDIQKYNRMIMMIERLAA